MRSLHTWQKCILLWKQNQILSLIWGGWKNLQLLELGVYKCCFNCPHKVFGSYIKEYKHIYPELLVIPCNFWDTWGKWVLSTCFYSIHTNGTTFKKNNFPLVILFTLCILKDLPNVHRYLWFFIHKKNKIILFS